MNASVIGAVIILGFQVPDQEPSASEVRIRVVDRKTGKGVPHAAVDVYAAEIVVADDPNSPYIGDSVLRVMWGEVGRLSVEADGEGVARFADGLGSVSDSGEVLILASDEKRRGARIVKVGAESA